MSSSTINSPNLISPFPARGFFKLKWSRYIIILEIAFIFSFLYSPLITIGILAGLAFFYFVSENPKLFLYFLFAIFIMFNHFRNTLYDKKPLYDYQLYRMSIIDITIICLVGIILFDFVVGRRNMLKKLRLRNRTLNIFITFILIASVYGLLVKGATLEDTIRNVRPFLYLIIYYGIAILFLDSKKEIKALVKFMFIITGFRALYGIILMFTDANRGLGGFPFTFHSQEVVFFMFFICMGLLALIDGNIPAGFRKLFIIPLPIIIVSTLYSYRRGIYVGMALGVLSLFYIWGYKRSLEFVKKYLWAILIIFFILVLSGSYLMRTSVIERSLSVTSIPSLGKPMAGAEASNFYRVWEIINGISNLRSSFLIPILGMGWGTKWGVYVPYPLNPNIKRLNEVHFHNTLLSFWLKGGIVVVFAFILIVIITLKRAKNAAEYCPKGFGRLMEMSIGLFMACFSISSLFGDYIYYWRIAPFIGVLLAISDSYHLDGD